MKKHNVESFNLDHTKVTAPYLRMASQKTGAKGDVVTKFDIRFTQPNVDFLPIAAMHTLEHLVAEYIRDEISTVIDFSPMGCRTGFYLVLFEDTTEEEVVKPLLTVLEKVAVWPEDVPVPGLDPVECGNYKEHDLEQARKAAKSWVEGIKQKGFSCFVD